MAKTDWTKVLVSVFKISSAGFQVHGSFGIDTFSLSLSLPPLGLLGCPGLKNFTRYHFIQDSCSPFMTLRLRLWLNDNAMFYEIFICKTSLLQSLFTNV